MRRWLCGCFSVLATWGAAQASPPMTPELALPLGGMGYAPVEDHGGSVPNVRRGQALAISCVGVRQSGATVQVVLQITRTLGETATGYDAVLATEQTVTTGKVHVRVPDVPGLSQHTVDVKVFVTDSSGLHRCDGGRVRIV